MVARIETFTAKSNEHKKKVAKELDALVQEKE